MNYFAKAKKSLDILYVSIYTWSSPRGVMKTKHKLIMNQNIRKNKTKQVLNMPKTSYYTLKQLFAINTHFNALVTIRVRHTKLVEDGKVVLIGTIVGQHGAPAKVYAKTPITDSILAEATAGNISLISEKLSGYTFLPPKVSTIPTMDYKTLVVN